MNSNAREQLLIALQEKQPGWHIQNVDSAKCIYRTIGKYGIEVSGGVKRPIRFHIYVWKKEKVYQIVERISDLDPRREDVVSLICSIAERYERKTAKKGSPTADRSSSENERFQCFEEQEGT